MRYLTTRHVGYAGKIHDPETSITFAEGDEGIRDRLIDLGAIEVDTAEEAPPPPPPPPPPPAASPKPLEEQSFAELKATAKAEKLPRYGNIKDEAKLRAAIEAHRAAQAS